MSESFDLRVKVKKRRAVEGIFGRMD